MKTEIPFNTIEKELIPTLKFSKDEVLKSKKDKKLRAHHLTRAAQLGNLLKNKVNIYFKDKENQLLRVTTTIWAVTNDSVVLKKSVVIPRNSIVYID